MNCKEYQQYVREGASEKYADAYFAALAMVGEVGEVCDVIKKANIYTEGEGYQQLRCRIQDELGDVLWQWVALANSFNLSMDDIIEYNVAKLNERHGGAQLDKTGGKR